MKKFLNDKKLKSLHRLHTINGVTDYVALRIAILRS